LTVFLQFDSPASSASSSRSGRQKQTTNYQPNDSTFRQKQEENDDFFSRPPTLGVDRAQFQKGLQGQRPQRVLQSHSARSRDYPSKLLTDGIDDGDFLKVLFQYFKGKLRIYVVYEEM